MNVYDKAHDLGWDLELVSTSTRPYEYKLRRTGWNRAGGPSDDTHVAQGNRDLEALLLAIEAGEPTERWRQF